MKRSLVFLTLMVSGLGGGLLACMLSIAAPEAQSRPASLADRALEAAQPLAEQSIPKPLPAASIAPGRLAQIDNLRLSTPRRMLRAAGDKVRIEVTLLNAERQAMGGKAPLRWSSSAPEILSVDAKGLVTAHQDEGRAQILVELAGTKVMSALPLRVSLSETIRAQAATMHDSGVWVHRD